jgi:hypothetical protein
MRGFAAIVRNAANIKLNTDIFIYKFFIMKVIIISNYNQVIFHTNIVITSSAMSAIALLIINCLHSGTSS